MFGLRLGEHNAEGGASEFPSYEVDISTRKQGALAGNGEADPHSFLLKGDGGLEQGTACLFTKAGAGIVNFDRYATFLDPGRGQDLASGAGGFGGVLKEIDEDAFHQVFVGHGARGVLGQPDNVVDLGVCRFEERDAVFEDGVDVEVGRADRRFGRKFGEGADAAAEGFDLIDHNLSSLFEEGAVGFGGFGTAAGDHLLDRQAD